MNVRIKVREKSKSKGLSRRPGLNHRREPDIPGLGRPGDLCSMIIFILPYGTTESSSGKLRYLDRVDTRSYMVARFVGGCSLGVRGKGLSWLGGYGSVPAMRYLI